ncbi:MAG: Mur ligase family protein [Clostridia bacterium]|nr:Mur ligase family protein [Clostridia bacterium]
MLVAGILGFDTEIKTADLIYNFFSSSGKKVGLINSGSLRRMNQYKIKKYIEEIEEGGTDVLIVVINILEIDKEIFDYFNFDVIIYSDKADDLDELKRDKHLEVIRKVFSMLDEKGIAIVNLDESSIIKFLDGMKHYVVTYGFNPKASITLSSIGDPVHKDIFMCCQQRTISTRSGKLIEPQEYRIHLQSDEIDAYNILAAATFAIVYGLDLNVVSLAGDRNISS